MKTMKRITALLLCSLMLSSGPLNAFATNMSGNDALIETTSPSVCTECGGSDAHTDSCSFYSNGSLDAVIPDEISEDDDTTTCSYCGQADGHVVGCFATFTEIGRTAAFVEYPVTLYYNPGTDPENCKSFEASSFSDNFVFTVQYSFPGEDGITWYMLDTENWDIFADTEEVYSYVPSTSVTFDLETEDTTSTPCAICGALDCMTAHLYCDICKQFDCGQTHTHENHYKPDTTPVIPAVPELTEGADVSIVDAEGNAITETGIQLNEGEKASFSAWSDLEDEGNASYQWQICYDAENDLWTDIRNQTGKGILISPAMVQSMLEVMGSAAIRCKITSGTSVQYSNRIPVTVAQETPLSMARFRLARTASNTAVDQETPELGEYTVVINYVFENNDIVADPYTATLAAGSSFSAIVQHPNVMGYLPYVGNDTETSAQIDLNITNIQADVTYTVTYKPTNVNYTVIHYQQNIDNDNYTIAETETKSGLTKTTVPDVAKDYTGFYALLYERPAIAADGSTVVEIYYDRNYYLVNFDMDGGYGTEPIYARYGAPVAAEDPIKAGHSFLGWSLNGTTIVDLPETVPAQNVTYKALWQAVGTAKVSVVFWGENPDDEGYSYIETKEIYAKPGISYTFSEDGGLICGYHDHDVDCYELICSLTPHNHVTNGCTLDCIHTAHTLDCYSTSGGFKLDNNHGGKNENEMTSDDGVYTYKTGGFWGIGATTHYYVKIGDNWYCSANGNENKITYSCSHTSHNNECYTCGEENHTHSGYTGSCYTLACTKPTHEHTNSCYDTLTGLDSKLWRFVESDTVTVAADGSTVVNVYYDRREFTLTFKQNSSTIKTITDKWGADIHGQFPIKNSSNQTMWWTVPSGCSSMKPGTEFGSLDTMPAENITFTYDSATSAATLHYYVEVLPGEDGKTASEIYNRFTANNYSGIDGTKKFESYKDINVTTSGHLTYTEEFHNITGFRQYVSYPKFDKHEQGGTTDDIKTDNYLLYARNTFGIVFYNPNELIKTQDNIPYQMPLSGYDWTPTVDQAPDMYEPGSVKFDGWYLNSDCSGEEFVFSANTMPAGANNVNGEVALALYAKWIPVTHTVSFYLDIDAYNAGTKLKSHPDVTVPHGEKMENAPKTPENGSYTFVGWFYMDNGVEKAFDFANMAINKDMQVYGKWSSNVLKEYFVSFKLEGTDTEIAAPITGSGLAGVIKTFDAKGGTDLYADYREGYFPLVKSHSMTLDIDANESNTYTFWYVQKDAVPYSVYYVTENQNKAGSLQSIELDGKTYYIVAETYTDEDNRQAVVTEKFETVSGYMPDAYQKRLVIDGTDGAENKIVFIYSEDTTHAYYKITHYTQNLDGETWTEYASSQAVGTIGETYTASPLSIDGFTYNSSVNGNLISGKLTAAGLELKLYYVRNDYPYEVRYLEQGTGKQLADPKPGTGKYGQLISEAAIDITGYTAVAPTSQAMTIKIEESETATLNIITFYYVEKAATISYVVVGPDGCGTVSLNNETVKVSTGTAKGSTATASTNYQFVGWYSDEACTQELSTDASYVPTKPDGGWTDVTYYAKFELAVVDLTITKSGWAAIDENQSFIFTIAGPNGFSMNVVIRGNGSVTVKNLPVGEYTVTENTDWSWRYTPVNSEKKITLTANGENAVSFNNKREKVLWLSGDCYVENWFTTGEIKKRDGSDNVIE